MNRIANKALKRRIIELSNKHALSGLSSSIGAVDIITEIYDLKKPEEKFFLSIGHAGLALYVVLEAKGGRNAEEVLKDHGTCPEACVECHIDASSGSLGHLGIAVGMALSDRTKNVYALISDAEITAGTTLEALRVMQEQQLTNLKLYVNVNGWSGASQINPASVVNTLRMYERNLSIVITMADYSDFAFLKSIEGRSLVMDDTQYKEAMELLTE